MVDGLVGLRIMVVEYRTTKYFMDNAMQSNLQEYFALESVYSAKLVQEKTANLRFIGLLHIQL